MSEVIDIPVIIIGGGGSGLSLSCFLSDYGVKHFLFEKRHGSSPLPKAHYVSQRTMEIFRQHNMSDELTQKSCPARHMSKVAWVSSVGGDGLADRKVLHMADCFGGDYGSPGSAKYANQSPVRPLDLPLYRMEPMLRKMAEERNDGGIFFDHIVVDFEDDGTVVHVTVKNMDGKETKYRTQYLVGADGGRTVGPKIGIQMDGPKGIADMVSVYFNADLSKYWDDRLFICHVINGNSSTVVEGGAIVPMGPKWGKHSTEWVFHFGFDLNDDSRFQEEKLVPRIRTLLRIPDLEIKPLRTNHWIIESVLASKYREGRVFVAGDAAHRHPPTTGLGLNTAIEDSHNLAWKLALALGGLAGPKVLDAYEAERRPIGRKNCDWGLYTFQSSSLINAAIGLVPGRGEENAAQFKALYEDSDVARARRTQISQVIDLQMIEFSAHDIELGFKYKNGVVLDDGTEPQEKDPLGKNYVPSTQPGGRLPHVWLEIDDKVISTHDVVGSDLGFALFTDEDGDDWVSTAKRFSKINNLKISAVQIGPHPHVRDWNDDWQSVKEFKRGGAVLVRPDNFVAWRSMGPSKKQGGELDDALMTLLGREAKLVNGAH